MIKINSYNNIEIEVSEDDGRFWATVEGERLQDTSYKGLITTINARAFQAAKTAKLNLAVVDKEGHPCKITGIHMGTGRPLTKPGNLIGPFYPDTPEIRTELAELKQMGEAYHAADARISKLKLSRSSGYQGSLSTADYTEAINLLEFQYNEVVASFGWKAAAAEVVEEQNA